MPENAIAIVGIALKVPGATSVDAFWRNLRDGVESITHFEDTELEDSFGPAVRNAANFVRARPVLEDADMFDAGFFGMHAREAELTDPQHRVFLECAWHALEDAGCDPARFPGPIGVFAGCSMDTYFLNNVCASRAATDDFTSGYQVGNYAALVGALPDFLATRASYKLDLKGPSMTLQSGCSTSLLAVTQACQSLLLHQADAALAGGVSITFPQKRGYLHEEGGMVSADGTCRPFDAAASGTIFGSGCGVVLLKRLEDAVAEGDRIYAVIRGCGVNNDGAAKVGFTAPSVDGQAAAISMALAAAQVDARTISYVECHGTATPLGDPIEIAGLTKAFRAQTADLQFCAIGSVKSNIGHLDAAAGVAGLIKTALSLQNRCLPPSLHFVNANPQIDFAASPFRVNSELAEWPGSSPRRAGVSAFGVGGTNVHVVLEEAPARGQHRAVEPSHQSQLLVLSARTPAALQAMRTNLAAHVREHPDLDLADVAYTLQKGRRSFGHRYAVVVRSRADAIAKLEGSGGHIGVARKDASLTFMFPGQGAQYPEMGRGLYESEPVYRTEFDRCAAVLLTNSTIDLRQLLYGSPDAVITAESLQATAFAQPALFALEYATARLWMSWGVHPQALIGHSVGEFVAATLAGVFTLEEALSLVAARGRLMQALPGGAMLAVRLPERDVIPLLAPAVSIAAINGPSLCVVSGPHAEIDALEALLTERGAVSRRLHTSHAFHSPMVDPIIEPLRERLGSMQLSPPSIAYVSCVSGDWVTNEEATSVDSWALHARKPVRFADGVATVLARGASTLLEVGPGKTLSALAAQTARRADDQQTSVIVSSLPDAASETTDRECMLEALGRLWIDGAEPDWIALQGAARTRVGLPAYPFERRRHWIDAPSKAPVILSEAKNLASQEIPRCAQDDGAAQDAGAAHRNTIVAILEDLSGEPLGTASPAATFLELGFDSLFLSQVAQRVQSQFKIKITFRQLLGELSTIAALADFIQTRTSQSSPAPAQKPVAAPATASTPDRFDIFKPVRSSADTSLTPRQREHVAALKARSDARTATSKRQTQQYRAVLADPRAAAGFRADWKDLVYPIVCERSSGSKIWDVDGNEYIDLVNGYGQIAFGHSPPFVVDAVKAQLEKGFAIGPQAELAGKVAALFCELTGNERMTFCNTGSEAVMAAMRVARAVTGRDKVVTFAGDYHGQFDEVLVKGTQRAGAPPRSLPIATGIPPAAVSNMIVLEYGAASSLQWIRDNASELAAVVVEPVQSRHPDLVPLEFLRELRSITEASGTAFVMDEVVTGFRVHPGGMQAVANIRADLATYGKVAGGGLPIGILAGKATFMDALDGGQWQYGDDSLPQVGVTFFAGTFVRHPLVLAACLAVLEHVKAEGIALQERLAGRTTKLVATLRAEFARYALTTKIEQFSSWFYFNIHAEHPLAGLLFHHLREQGIHAQDGFPCFLTTAHSDADLQRIAHGFRAALAQLCEAGIIATTAEPATIPLTESQVEIWLAAQLGEAASCAFNESVTLHLHGALDRDALQGALDRVVARHDALRASFTSTGEGMRIAPTLSLRCPSVDLSALAPAAGEAAFAKLLDADARTPFDLEKGPLIRAQLVRRSEAAHELVLTLHHIICDGWSANVVVGELAQIYDALCRGVEPELPAAPSFASFARAQRQRDASELARVEAFWLTQFAVPPSPLDLPTDRSRPAIRSFSGATRCRRIDATLYKKVKAAGAQQGCTLFVSLLAGFQALIGRLAAQQEIVVGVPTAGQSLLADDGAQALVGHCVNFLPIASRWNATTRVSEFLQALRQTVLAAYEHQDYTLGTLVRKLALPREAGRVPLAQIQFNLERLPDRLRSGALEIEVEPNPKAHVNFDLFFNVIESSHGLRIDCDYNTDLFDAATIDTWLECYEAVLAHIAADGAQPLARLSILSAAQRHEVLEAHNQTASDDPRDRSAHQLFEMQAAAHPQAIAVRSGDMALTYAELDWRANQLAHQLRSRVGAKANSGSPLVGVLVERSPDLLVALLATMKAGLAYVPLDPAHPVARLRHILVDAGVALLIGDATAAAEIAGASLPIIDLQRDAATIARLPITTPAIAIDTDRVAYVIYTSGSTGLPKGVEVTQRSLVNLLSAMARQPGLAKTDVLLAVTTISFDIAGLELLLPLAVGATVVIAAREESADGFQLLERLRSCGATAMQATPAGWRLLLEAGFVAPDGFKMLCGGEALPRDLASRLLAGAGELWNMYGPTETTIWSSCARIAADDSPISVGKPIANTQFYVLDAVDQPAAPGIAGQLHIGGDGVARGYHARPELTHEKFIANPFGPGRIYRTGDVARLLPGGDLQILGRVDHQIKLRGFRIEPGEIEALLRARSEVADAVVVLREDTAGHARLVAYYVAASGHAPSPPQLRAALAPLLPEHMIPSAWVALAMLPRLANGKLDRAALPVPEAATSTVKAPTEPRTALEASLLRIWSGVLQGGPVGTNDDVFDLGADSIQLFQIAARAAREGLPLTVKQLMQHRTIVELAKSLR